MKSILRNKNVGNRNRATLKIRIYLKIGIVLKIRIPATLKIRIQATLKIRDI